MKVYIYKILNIIFSIDQKVSSLPDINIYDYIVIARFNKPILIAKNKNENPQCKGTCLFIELNHIKFDISFIK